MGSRVMACDPPGKLSAFRMLNTRHKTNFGQKQDREQWGNGVSLYMASSMRAYKVATGTGATIGHSDFAEDIWMAWSSTAKE